MAVFGAFEGAAVSRRREIFRIEYLRTLPALKAKSPEAVNGGGENRSGTVTEMPPSQLKGGFFIYTGKERSYNV